MKVRGELGIVVDRGELVKGGEAGNGTGRMLVDAFGELPDLKLLLKSVLVKPHIQKFKSCLVLSICTLNPER